MKRLPVLTAVLIFFCLTSANAISIHNVEVSLAELSKKLKQHRGPNQIYWNEGLPSSEFLLVTLGGTNSLPKDLKDFSETAVGAGYSVIGLDYDNSVISTTCGPSTNSLCFEQFRREVTRGDAGSEVVKVNRENSLENRLLVQLRSLAAKDSLRWAGFLDANKNIVWDHIVIVGHSQGSGHAAFLAKNHKMKAVILLAGPQDRFENSSMSVSWLSAPGLTDPKYYFALLHEKDFFGFQNQRNNISLLRQEKKSAAALVNVSVPSGTETPIIITRAAVRDGHMAVIQKDFKDLWLYLLLRSNVN